MKRFTNTYLHYLVVVAHPDDIEFVMAPFIAFVKQSTSASFTYFILSSGEAGIDTLTKECCQAVREQEQRCAAQALGVDSVRFGRLPDGELTYDAVLDSLNHLKNDSSFDAILLMNDHDTWPGGSKNHRDHVVAGKPVFDTYHSRLPILTFGSPKAAHYTTLDEPAVELAIKALSCHAEYLKHVKLDAKDVINQSIIRDAEGVKIFFEFIPATETR